MRTQSYSFPVLWTLLSACSMSEETASPGPEEPGGAQLAAADLQQEIDGEERGPLLPPTATPFGRSMVDWTQRWSKWIYGIPADRNPQLDQTGEDCDEDQSGPVWFLASVTTGGAPTVIRSCTLPVGKAVLFSAGGSLWDYPCPDPAHEPAPGQTLYDFLRNGAKLAVDGIAALSINVDGHDLEDPFSYRHHSPRLFQITGHPSLVEALDPCITGEPQPAVNDGYFYMTRPLREGNHTITTQSTRAGRTTTRIWNLTVVRP